MTQRIRERQLAVVVAKAPRPGEVKTRLAARFGSERAAGLYACFLRDTLAAVEAARAASWSLRSALCYSPKDGERDFDSVAADVGFRFPQRGVHLGERLTNCFADAFSLGADAVVALGADTPNLPPDYIRQAFGLLTDPGRVVYGPCADGGYYLVGMRRLHKAIFEAVPWSTTEVLAASLSAAETAGLRCELLPWWYDVDTPDDLDRLRADLARDPKTAGATWDFLARTHAP